MTPSSIAVPPVSRLNSARNRPVHTIPRRHLRSFRYVGGSLFPGRSLSRPDSIRRLYWLAWRDVLHPDCRPSRLILQWRHACLQSFPFQLATQVLGNPFLVLRWKIRVHGPMRPTLQQPCNTTALRQIQLHSPTNWCRFLQSKRAC
jgi:hypothetical protein